MLLFRFAYLFFIVLYSCFCYCCGLRCFVVLICASACLFYFVVLSFWVLILSFACVYHWFVLRLCVCVCVALLCFCFKEFYCVLLLFLSQLFVLYCWWFIVVSARLCCNVLCSCVLRCYCVVLFFVLGCNFSSYTCYWLVLLVMFYCFVSLSLLYLYSVYVFGF